MKKYWVVANWKLNHTHSTAVEWINSFMDIYKPSPSVAVGVAPSHTEIALISDRLKQYPDAALQVMGQDVSRFNNGKYTGEVGGFQLLEYGVSACIVGHSERRQYFNETDDIIIEKIERLLNYAIQPLVAVSEIDQVRAVCESSVDKSRLSWAYEPVSAIGTGNPADPDSVVAFINSMKPYTGEQATVLYGGSVAPANVRDYARLEGVDGFLVGNASIKADDFNTLIQNLYEV